jgi:hypothetical protein
MPVSSNYTNRQISAFSLRSGVSIGLYVRLLTNADRPLLFSSGLIQSLTPTPVSLHSISPLSSHICSLAVLSPFLWLEIIQLRPLCCFLPLRILNRHLRRRRRKSAAKKQRSKKSSHWASFRIRHFVSDNGRISTTALSALEADSNSCSQAGLCPPKIQHHGEQRESTPHG